MHTISFFQPPFYSRNTAEMYDNILNKPLQLKPNITNSARHLLEGLLQKDRTKRLGAKDDFVSQLSLILLGSQGCRFEPQPHSPFNSSSSKCVSLISSQQMEIKSHVFFSLINWDDLINKKITPPFNPNVVSSKSQGDPREQIFLSPSCTSWGRRVPGGNFPK